MKLIGSCSLRKDHVLSVILVHIALKQKDLREEALFALWHVRTHRVLPQLLLFAEKGYSSALYMVRPMLQTPEEIERGIVIARKYLDANDYPLRETALFLLQKYSSMETEAEWVLAAVQKYMDELFIDALKDAEYGDLSSTIEVLKQKEQSR
jgi:hypothetical protein